MRSPRFCHVIATAAYPPTLAWDICFVVDGEAEICLSQMITHRIFFN